MKKLAVLLSTSLLILGIFSTAGALTINAIDDDWINAIGGVNVNHAHNIAVAYGNVAEDQVKWGRSTGFGSSADDLINSSTSPEGYNKFILFWGRITTHGSGEMEPVPEPATMILFGAGLVGLAGAGLRKKK